MRLREFINEMLPITFSVMSETGHQGHCILTSRVLDHVFYAVDVGSEPLCVDYEVANPAANAHLKAGGSRDRLRGEAHIIMTGSGKSGVYDHHVVTLIPFSDSSIIVDPSIVQTGWKIPHVEMNMIILNMPYPLPASHSVEVNGSLLTYTFHPSIKDFTDNEQWKDDEPARGKAEEILRRMGFLEVQTSET